MPHEPSLLDDILFWFPGLGWFYYLFFGYTPRTINHFNPVNRFDLFLIFNYFILLFKFEPLFYNKHLIGVCSSLGTYLGMVIF
jgi:hypothetical protein